MPAQINTEPMRQQNFAIPDPTVLAALAPQIAKWIKKNNATTRTEYTVYPLEYKVIPDPNKPKRFTVTNYQAIIRITAVLPANGNTYIVDLYNLTIPNS